MKETEPSAEKKVAGLIPEGRDKTLSGLRPELIQRVHKFYEEIGRETVRAVEEWEGEEQTIGKNQTDVVPKPENAAAKPKPENNATEHPAEVKAVERTPEVKAIEQTPDIKATEQTPEVKGAEPKPSAKWSIPKFDVRNKIIFSLAIIGILAGFLAAYYFSLERKASPPVFNPISNPYDKAIYANGIIESEQAGGSNINIYPEVSGPITRLLVREGEQVSVGAPLFTIDDSVQKAAVALASANLKAANDQYVKRRDSYDIDARSISKDVLDTAKNAVFQATAALKAANALLNKYSVKAPINGIVLAINTSPGSYVSSQGSYDSYTQGLNPLVVMGGSQDYLSVRCFVDEILVSRLPAAEHIQAQVSIRGTDLKVPLEFVRIQPYVSPKIELANQRQEKVDLRVLPVIFRFPKKNLPMVYPGQLVDVFIGEK